MASHVIALLAASGLLASGAAQASNIRSADALPTAKVALVKVAPARSAGCFSAINGKSLKIAKGAKMKCSNPAFADVAAGGTGVASTVGFSTIAGVTSLAVAGSALGLSISNSNSNVSGG